MFEAETGQRLPFLAGDGEMIARVRAFDWSANPLGEPDGWLRELVAAVSLVLESRFPAMLAWGPQRIVIYNDAFRPILGDKVEALGRPLAHVWAEVWNEIEPIVDRAFAGEATFIEDFPLMIDRYGYLEQAFFTFCYSPVRLADGTVCGMLDTVMETTSAVAARERARFVNNELGHRLKNTMSMVQAMAMQSLKKVPEREPVRAFNDRIVALGRAHDILLQTSWEGAAVRAVIDTMLASHGGDGRYMIDGADVMLGPKGALSLSMLLHELSTNAAKYGALSVPDGHVELDWCLEGEGDATELVLDWRERGGPPAVEPTRTGFGSRLINLGLGGTGNVAKHYLVSGFEAKFRAPLHKLLLS